MRVDLLVVGNGISPFVVGNGEGPLVVGNGVGPLVVGNGIVFGSKPHVARFLLLCSTTISEVLNGIQH